jgi:glycosyltransferase involved in cell wall biosynthesis
MDGRAARARGVTLEDAGRLSLRVIAFVPHPAGGASSRYRVIEMIEPLAAHGVQVDVRPFLDASAYAVLYHPGRVARKAADIARGGWRRWRDLEQASRYDLALVHREMWPIVGISPIARLARHQPRWVFDLDDAVWIPNVSDANRAFARVKPFGHPAQLAAGARAVAAGNDYLAEWARRQRPGRPAGEVETIPTAVDTDRWRPRPRPPGPPRLVWIGSPSTLPHLALMRGPIERVARRHPGLELHTIGGAIAAPGVRVVQHPWSHDTEADLVAAGDVGLAPLPDDPWCRGKCGLKLLLYMASGVAAVASRAGVHDQIVTHGVDGWLADGPDGFESSLDSLLGDPALRARLGAAARATVERRFARQAVAPRLADLLRRAAAS